MTPTRRTLIASLSLVLCLAPVFGSHTAAATTRFRPATAPAAEVASTPALSMSVGRQSHTSTLLTSGKVLVVGGYDGSVPLATAELYDPATGTWSSAGSLAQARYSHTATLLPSGKVLVAGGTNITYSLGSAELYDPDTNTWSPAGSMADKRFLHTATLLASGKVLVAGGFWGGGLTSAELYDPATDTWSPAASMTVSRDSHTATLLASGKVLVAGGEDYDSTASAEIYDPAADSWSTAASMAQRRSYHTATLLATGEVLVAGGRVDNSATIASVELYDPAADTWAPAPDLSGPRDSHTATLLATGKVLVAGGVDVQDELNPFDATAQLYDPVSSSWSSPIALDSARSSHAVTLLHSGDVLITGGYKYFALASAEIFDPFSAEASSTAPMSVGRYSHTSTLLTSGKVLVVGGYDGSVPLATAELYDPAAGTWSPAGSLAQARGAHTATLLPSGKVLVAGGDDDASALASAELYDPATNTWSPAGSMADPRLGHTATLLPSGKVLVAGGYFGENSVELYDPATDTWSPATSMTVSRAVHTATLLPSGKVLVAGGIYSGISLASAEIYDPAADSWSAAASMAQKRNAHTATLLATGEVLVAGGNDSATTIAGVELYDPAADTWAPAPDLSVPRDWFTATLLPTGKMLFAGGTGFGSVTAELYDPVSSIGSSTVALASPHEFHCATLLTSGRVLLTGGFGYPSLASADLLSGERGFGESWRPVLTSATSPLTPDVTPVTASGSGFTGISEASGGSTAGSATNYPVVVIRAVDGGITRAVPVTGSAGWSGTSSTGVVPADFPLGWAYVTVFTNAVPSASRLVLVQPAPPCGPVSCPDDVTVDAAPGQCSAQVTFAAPTGGCGTVTCSPASGSTFPLGATTVTCTADGDPSSSCSFLVTVAATQNQLTCPLDVTVDAAPGQCSAPVTFAAPTGSCGTVTCSPASGSTFPVGATTVTCTADDNPSSSCSFLVKVVDAEAPQISCPVGVTAQASVGTCSAVVTYATPTASDNCPGTVVSCVPASGSVFPFGTTTVTCKATDASSVVSQCAFPVNVVGGPAINVGSISGPAVVAAGDGVTYRYSVTRIRGVSYTWTVPPYATIVSGQGRNSIFVQFATKPGNVSVVASDGCSQSGSATMAVTVSGFDWAFGDANLPLGWADAAEDVGLWSQDSGSFATLSGALGGGTAIYDSTHYDTPYDDFTYEVEINRTGSLTSSNTVFVRGTPQPYVTAQASRWNSGYAFSIARTGRFGVWRFNGSTVQTLQAWATPVGASAINTAPGAPNRLRVVASGGTIAFYINYDAQTNPNPVYVISNAAVATGLVGVGAVRTGAGELADAFRVNWARLTPALTTGPGAGVGAVTNAQAAANKRAKREGYTDFSKAPQK